MFSSVCVDFSVGFVNRLRNIVRCIFKINSAILWLKYWYLPFVSLFFLRYLSHNLFPSALTVTNNFQGNYACFM